MAGLVEKIAAELFVLEDLSIAVALLLLVSLEAGFRRGRGALQEGDTGAGGQLGAWVTTDLDHPRSGFMQLSDAPLAALELDAPSPGSG